MAKAIKSGRGKIRSVTPCAVFGNDSASASSPDNIQIALHVRRSLAKHLNRRVGLEQQPGVVGIAREKRQPSLDFWAKDFDAPLPRAPLGFHSFFVVQHSLPPTKLTANN
jgi:hypothetical protein